MTAPGVGDVIKFLHKFFLHTVVEIARLVDTFGSAKALVRPNSVFSCSLSRSSAMRSTLRCLVPPWSSAPRILTNSLLVLKGDSMNMTLLVSSAEVRYHLFLCLSLRLPVPQICLRSIIIVLVRCSLNACLTNVVYRFLIFLTSDLNTYCLVSKVFYHFPVNTTHQFILVYCPYLVPIQYNGFLPQH